MQRRRRLSAEQTREALLEHGTDLMFTRGLSSSLSTVTLEAAIRSAGLPRSSAYNAFSKSAFEKSGLAPAPPAPAAPSEVAAVTSSPSDTNGSGSGGSAQELFRRELLHRLIEISTERSSGSLRDLMISVLRETADWPRRARLEEVIRVVCNAQVEASRDDRELKIATGILAAAAAGADAVRDAELIGWLRASDAARVARISDALATPLDVSMGIRPRPEMDGPDVWMQFAHAAGALAAGSFPRVDVTPDELQYVERQSNGVTKKWSLYALSVLGLVDVFFEQERGSHGASRR